MAFEIERKYLDVNTEELVSRLKELGAISTGLHFESNFVYDTPDRSLFARGQLLRLRQREWPGRTDCVLTAKKSQGRTIHGAKIREEDETRVDDFAAMRAILTQLGYEVVLKYEKTRESWRLALPELERTLKIDMDTLPFGTVVELEGDLDSMDVGARVLDLGKYDTSSKTYYELGRRWRISKGMEEDGDLVFDVGLKRALRATMGLPNPIYSAYL